ncbi:hypothetical protein ABZW11_21865 [Nonomuraea sp. NPDC004580]|uniref:hypothetical protein n=1 Tax=Nonomuraea sp. NPDC004580 TaxID=3154552 RepID=UPI0033B01BFB
MSRPRSRIGWKATIVDTFHSHTRTQAHHSALVGRQGVVAAVLSNGTTALIQLDGLACELPNGIRRWPLQWDDLELKEPTTVAGPPALVTGLRKMGQLVELHAVKPGSRVALCSSPARPLPMCGWSVPFSATAPRACPTCVAMVKALEPVTSCCPLDEGH